MRELFCSLLLCGCTLAQTVEGTVTNSVTGVPIPGLKVEIVQGATVNGATTDPQGRFLFDNLKDGAWTVRYPSTDYSSRPDRVQVTAGSPVRLQARLTPFPRISGRILDGRNEPIPKATFVLTSSEAFWAAPTDAAGKFELRQGLPPGDYTLSATPPTGLKPPDPEPDSGRILAWARTYYPGTTLAETAVKLHLAPGVELAGIDVKLLAVPAHAVRGVCLSPEGSPAGGVKILLEEGRPFPPAMTVESKSDGTFEFPAVVDAEWTLSAQVEPLQATQWVEMAGHDVEGMTLRLSQPFTVSGKVVMEVPPGMPAPRPPLVRLHTHITRIMIDTGLGAGGLMPRMLADGSFTIDKVYPGSYSVDPAQPTAPYYLDTIRVGGVEMTTPEVELTGPLSIVLLYKANSGSVRGTVEGCSPGSVWLVPQEPAQRSRFFRFVDCDDKGAYNMPAVRPGEYYAVANAGTAIPRPWLFGIFDQTLLNQSAKVTVRPGEATSADLRLR